MEHVLNFNDPQVATQLVVVLADVLKIASESIQVEQGSDIGLGSQVATFSTILANENTSSSPNIR